MAREVDINGDAVRVEQNEDGSYSAEKVDPQDRFVSRIESLEAVGEVRDHTGEVCFAYKPTSEMKWGDTEVDFPEEVEHVHMERNAAFDGDMEDGVFFRVVF
jgi:hypothetical protein